MQWPGEDGSPPEVQRADLRPGGQWLVQSAAQQARGNRA